MSASPQCIRCGQELPGEVLFCPYCGTRQRPEASPIEVDSAAQPQRAPETLSYAGVASTPTDVHEPPKPVGFVVTDTSPDSLASSPTLPASAGDATLQELASTGELKATTPTGKKPLNLEQGLLPKGSVLSDNYVIEEVVGEGGMGVVYRATDRLVGRDVAIKMLHANLLGDAGIRRRFLREARLMSGWSHPHVVQVYDLLEQDRLLAIVMEFIDGITLTQSLEQWGGKLPFDEINSLFSDILSTMEEAHNQGIIHRDLKPDNILLRKMATRMFPKIVDFGLAKILEGTTYTVSGALLGTCQYMSPEQIQDQQMLDHRADIYALGITLYQMSTGRCPFQESNHFALMMAHVNQAPPKPSQFRPDIPPALEALILDAIAKEPDARPQDCGTFRRRLQEALGELGPAAPAFLSRDLEPRIERKDGHELLLIPEGEFLLGSSRRSIYLDAYYIDRTPVTNLQFQTFLQRTGYKPKGSSNRRFLSHWGGTRVPEGLEEHPVVFVSWDDARAYAAWAGLHLPTEAQWEKAARGDDGRKYPWGREDPTPRRAHFGRRQMSTLPVGSHPEGASPYDILDLAGNVWEWCEDVDVPSFYSSGPTHNPRNVLKGHHTPKYVVRGGSWMYDARSLRTTTRTSYEPHFRLDDVGFRCVYLPT